MTDRVAQQIRAMPERHRFIRGMRSWVGFRQIGVPYDRSARAAGESKFTVSKLLLLALDGIFTFSELPVRLATLVGTVVATVSFLWGLRTLLWRLFGDPTAVPGFATLACAVFFLAGIQLICLGILGEYVARIHNEVKRRPVYVVDRLLGFDSPRSRPTSDSEEQAALLELHRTLTEMGRELRPSHSSPSASGTEPDATRCR
jgi:dolichol-phosphate mannosyltransferase